MQSNNYAYVNGRFVHEAEATVSIFDRGFLYGDGAFETMRVYQGKIFRPIPHLSRLCSGLRFLNIVSPLSPEELRAVSDVLIERNRVQSGVVRVYITSGPCNLGSLGEAETPPTVIAVAQSRTFDDVKLRAIVAKRRLDVALSSYKTANRLPYILAKREAALAGVDDAVLLNAWGDVVEFTVSNLFAVKSGDLFTPPLNAGPLPGVTRRTVIALAEELRIPVHEKAFASSFLDTADEVFATNSLIEVAPVVTWSRQSDVTTRLQTAYRELVTRELNTPGP